MGVSRAPDDGAQPDAAIHPHRRYAAACAPLAGQRALFQALTALHSHAGTAEAWRRSARRDDSPRRRLEDLRLQADARSSLPGEAERLRVLGLLAGGPAAGRLAVCVCVCTRCSHPPNIYRSRHSRRTRSVCTRCSHPPALYCSRHSKRSHDLLSLTHSPTHTHTRACARRSAFLDASTLEGHDTISPLLHPFHHAGPFMVYRSSTFVNGLYRRCARPRVVRLRRLRHLTSPHPTPHHPTSPHLTPPHLTSPHLTAPHRTSPHLTPIAGHGSGGWWQGPRST